MSGPLRELTQKLQENVFALLQEAERLETLPPAGESTELLTEDGLAKELGVHRRTVWVMRKRGEAPPCIYIGQRRRYEPSTIRSWLKQRRQAA
jgi:predicted DNA-binding transcriptional regulator AlpA